MNQAFVEQKNSIERMLRIILFKCHYEMNEKHLFGFEAISIYKNTFLIKTISMMLC